MQGLMSRARCNTTCCNADPGPRLLEESWIPDQQCTVSRFALTLHRVRDTALCLVLALSLASIAHAQAPDTVLLNGKIVVYDAPPARALAVRDGRIAGTGGP